MGPARDIQLLEPASAAETLGLLCKYLLMKEVCGTPPNLPDAVVTGALFGILDGRVVELLVLAAPGHR